MCAILALAVPPAAGDDELDRLSDRLVALRTRTQLGEPPADLRGELIGLVDEARDVALSHAHSLPDAAMRIMQGANTAALSLTAAGEDAEDMLVAGLEDIRTGVLAVAEGRPVGRDRSATELLRWLSATFGVTQRDIARLLGVAPRTVQRWLSGESTMPQAEEDRLRLLTRALNELRFAYTGPAALAWLVRDHPLAGRRPIDLLAEADGAARLLALVATARY
jgi:transcriptional regulator with XRE-family HTH domain